ncbi:cytosolic factor, phosphatidylinositol/phosphatidylcholine transfer protein [Nowakowskiella sp. JEL0407]|nr:cytosolic factor, phosphatidylinositol/phosphatidylcholine transfer protein [Nowakowskiella sp. JEL0407]
MEESIKEFRERLSEEFPDQATRFDDPMLIRFLVARSSKIDDAHEMLLNYLTWRINNKIDELPNHGIDAPLLCAVRGYKCIKDGNYDPNVEGVSESFRKFADYLGGSAYHKFDKTGTPIFFERLGMYDAKQVASNATIETWSDFHIRNMEMLVNHLMKEASEKTGRVIDKHTVIFDLKGLGFAHMYYPVLQLIRATSNMESLNYPERLGKFFMINAPYIFTRIWSIVKGWLDQGIIDKIHILGDDYKEVLLSHIDADQLPVEFGGTCECAHVGGCVPIRKV